MKALFPGRFQPFHDGHEAVVRQLLEDGHQVVIGVRDTMKGPDNPYSMEWRIMAIARIFEDEPDVDVWPMPDFEFLAHGRDPGWRLVRVNVSASLAEIKARDLRR